MKLMRPGALTVSASVVLIALAAAYLAHTRVRAKDSPPGQELRLSDPIGSRSQSSTPERPAARADSKSGSAVADVYGRKGPTLASPEENRIQPTPADPPTAAYPPPRPERTVILVPVEVEQVRPGSGRPDNVVTSLPE